MTSVARAPARVTQQSPPRRDSSGAGTERRPRWGRWAQGMIAALAGALYLSNLSVNGLGNPYYAAAVKSGSVSWKAFLFGSLDPGSFITVDKPPAAFWVQEISVRLFGYSSWSILVPEALAGAAAVAVTYHLARRFSGEVAGVLAGLALAVTPMAAVMFRFNDPDAMMTLLIVLAAWAVWAAVERASIRHLVGGGLLLGLAFDAKMLEAFVVLPALALVWFVAAPTSWRRRLWGWLWSGLAVVVSAGWWVAVVELWPNDARPYIGSTSDNSLLSLIFGYNGLSRLLGSHAGRPGGGGGGGGAFGGGAGWTRLFGDTLGSQISWLIPLAALGLVGGLVLAGRAPLANRRRAGFVMWGVWGLTAFGVFSKSSGTFHPYYTVALAPAVAVLAAAGAVALWDLGRLRRCMAWMLPVGVAGSALWSYTLLDRNPHYHPWLRIAIVIAGMVAAGALAVALLWPVTAEHATRRPAQRLSLAATGLAAVALLSGPLAWSISTVTHQSSGSNPTAGPASAAGAFGGGHRLGAASRAIFGRGGSGTFGTGGAGGFGGGGGLGGGGGFGGASAEPTAGDRKLVSYLEAQRGSAKYIVATDGSMSADALIVASGKPVMAMGGFSGGDPAPTLAQFEHLVAQGQVRYVLSGGGFGGRGGRGGSVTQIEQWAAAHGTVVPAADYGDGVTGTLYEVTPATVAATGGG